MTAQPRTTARVRSLSAVLLGVLTVLASIVGPPAAAGAGSAAQSATPAAAVRAPIAPVGGLRESRAQPRALHRRGLRDGSAPSVAAHRSTDSAQGSAPAAGVLPAALALLVLAVAALASTSGAGRRPRRTAGVRRDRAPPALALA